MIGTGGFIGTVLRYLLGQFIHARIGPPFPFGTLTINIIGSFVIGLVFAASEKGMIDQDWRLFLAVGICGGFTTFSAFSLETLNLLRGGYTLYAFSYVTASLALGFLATFSAIAIMKAI